MQRRQGPQAGRIEQRGRYAFEADEEDGEVEDEINQNLDEIGVRRRLCSSAGKSPIQLTGLEQKAKLAGQGSQRRSQGAEPKAGLAHRQGALGPSHCLASEV